LLAVTSLPERLTKSPSRPQWIRASLLIPLVAIYIVPQNGAEAVARFLPDIREAWRGAMALARVKSSPNASPDGSFFERRLGFRLMDAGMSTRMRAGVACPFHFSVTCGDLARLIDEIRAAVGKRRVFLDIPLDDKITVSSTIYFFADLNPATSNPEVVTTLWTKSDLDGLRATLAQTPPECVISWGGKLTPMLQELLGTYTSLPVRNGAVYCKVHTPVRHLLSNSLRDAV
jgi:hypothetical protein